MFSRHRPHVDYVHGAATYREFCGLPSVVTIAVDARIEAIRYCFRIIAVGLPIGFRHLAVITTRSADDAARQPLPVAGPPTPAQIVAFQLTRAMFMVYAFSRFRRRPGVWATVSQPETGRCHFTPAVGRPSPPSVTTVEALDYLQQRFSPAVIGHDQPVTRVVLSRDCRSQGANVAEVKWYFAWSSGLWAVLP